MACFPPNKMNNAIINIPVYLIKAIRFSINQLSLLLVFTSFCILLMTFTSLIPLIRVVMVGNSFEDPFRYKANLIKSPGFKRLNPIFTSFLFRFIDKLT